MGRWPPRLSIASAISAGAYYWKLWFPGFDWSLPSSVAEVTRIEKFWLDTGIDGFMWDVGTSNPLFKPSAVDLPKSYTSNDKWLTFERANSSNAAVYKDFGLTSWFNYKDDAIACVSLCGCRPDVRRISAVRSSGSDEGSGLRDGRRVMS